MTNCRSTTVVFQPMQFMGPAELGCTLGQVSGIEGAALTLVDRLYGFKMRCATSCTCSAEKLKVLQAAQTATLSS